MLSVRPSLPRAKSVTRSQYQFIPGSDISDLWCPRSGATAGRGRRATLDGASWDGW